VFHVVRGYVVISQNVPLLRWRNLNLEKEFVLPKVACYTGIVNCSNNHREGRYSLSHTSPLYLTGRDESGLVVFLPEERSVHINYWWSLKVCQNAHSRDDLELLVSFATSA
jgi:hypothetical protein